MADISPISTSPSFKDMYTVIQSLATLDLKNVPIATAREIISEYFLKIIKDEESRKYFVRKNLIQNNDGRYKNVLSKIELSNSFLFVN